MPSKRLHSFLIASLLFSAAAAAVALKPAPQTLKVSAIQLERMIPVAFGDWKIDSSIIPIQPTPDAQMALNKIYDQVLTRVYVNNKGEHIMLSIAYGGSQTNDLKTHRQEVCYTAQGFKISGLIHQTIDFGNNTIPVTRMLAQKGERFEPVTYWFTMGDRVVLSRMERLLVQLKFGLSGEIPDVMLVRVSNLSTNIEASYGAHVNFVHELIGSMRKEDVLHLMGAVGS